MPLPFQRIGLTIAGIFISLCILFSGFTIPASRVTPITFGPPVVHAGDLLNVVLVAAVIVVAVYVANPALLDTAFSVTSIATPAGTTVGYGALGGAVTTNTAFAAAMINNVVSSAIQCIAGYICGSDSDSGGGSTTAGVVEEGVFNVAPGTAPGGECYGPANSCGQAYPGTYEEDPATGNMGCKISNSFNYGAPPESGCTGPSVTVTVTPANPATTPDPGAADTTITIDSGASVTLTWDAPSAVSCAWVGGSPTSATLSNSGSTTVSPTTTTSYQIHCADPDDHYGTLSSVTVVVLTPQVSINADPVRVRSGSSSVITWSGVDVKSCAVTSSVGGSLASGNATASHTFSAGSPLPTPVTTQTTFTITCQTNGNPITKSVLVNVVPTYQEF